jgi:hypothetical protein
MVLISLSQLTLISKKLACAEESMVKHAKPYNRLDSGVSILELKSRARLCWKVCFASQDSLSSLGHGV